MNLDEFQRRCLATDKGETRGLDSEKLVLEAALGLLGEAGSVADLLKKRLRDGISAESQKGFLEQELGDILWYVAILAHRHGLKFADVAARNLRRTENRYGTADGLENQLRLHGTDLRLDRAFPEAERFPDAMEFEFRAGIDADGRATTQMVIVSADPNPFPDGQISSVKGGKGLGFTLNSTLVEREVGDPLRDNAPVDDGYRFHDVLHLAFMAVLGWSPVMRDLLRLKRKSVPSVDDTADSRRACDVEEGLSTYLANRSRDYNGFIQMRYVDNSTIDYVLEQVRNESVAAKPGWLWRRAIHQGFSCWRTVHNMGGGRVRLDLKQCELSVI